jgi:hypothetical protein
MSEQQEILIVDGSDDYYLTSNLPEPRCGYSEYFGPYGMAHFERLFSKTAVGSQRVAEIASMFIKDEYR